MEIRFARIFFIIITLLSLCSLSSAGCLYSNTSSPTITISTNEITLDSDGENTEQKILTFRWEVKNNSSKEILLQWINPIPPAGLSGRLLTEDTKVNVGKVIGPGEKIEVMGAFTIDASGLTEQEIAEKCNITAITISTESTVQADAVVFISQNQDII